MTDAQNALLVEEAAIMRAINGYTDALNHREWNVVGSFFLPKAVWRTVNFQVMRFENAEGIVEGLKAIVVPSAFLLQMRTSTAIKINGVKATARSTMHEIGEFQGTSFVCYGSYSDSLERQNDGTWRFAERTFRYIYWQTGSLTGQSFPLDS